DEEDDENAAVLPTGKKPDLPHDVSAQELDVSMEEQRVQSRVQRAKVLQMRALNGEAMGDHEQMEFDADIGELRLQPPITDTKIKGLGGRMDADYDNESMYDDYDIANWRDEVPEKKPKIDMDALNYVYEESKRLLELSTLSARPVHRITLKCSEPRNVFKGGVEARKSVGYKKSSVMNLACARGSSCRVSWSQGECTSALRDCMR
ncbi:unnamed protein product, partial [Cylicostephanus goldi]